MNIGYYLSAYIIILILCFSSVVKASEYAFIEEQTDVIIASAVLKTDMSLNKQIIHTSHEVFISAHQDDHNTFWKSIESFFGKVYDVYKDLLSYLYNAILSIFNW